MSRLSNNSVLFWGALDSILKDKKYVFVAESVEQKAKFYKTTHSTAEILLIVQDRIQNYTVGFSMELQPMQFSETKILNVINAYNKELKQNSKMFYSSHSRKIALNAVISRECFDEEVRHNRFMEYLAEQLSSFEKIYRGELQKIMQTSSMDQQRMPTQREKIQMIKVYIDEGIKKRDKSQKMFNFALSDSLKKFKVHGQVVIKQDPSSDSNVSLLVEEELQELETSTHSSTILRRIILKEKDICRSWKQINGSYGNLKKLKVTYNILIDSVNSEVNIQIPDPHYESKEGYLIQKTPNKSGKASFKTEVTILQILRNKSCPSIASYFVEEINKEQIVKKLFSEYEPFQMSNQNIVPRDKLAILNQLSEAIKFLFRQSILHRDLKLSNIIVSNEMQPKVIDFGSACPSFNNNQNLNIDYSLKTTVNYNINYKETPQHLIELMSKQQFEQHENFDVYSFGVIIEKLLDQTMRVEMGNFFVFNLIWLVRKCKQYSPYDRISPQYLHLFLKYLWSQYNISKSSTKVYNK